MKHTIIITLLIGIFLVSFTNGYAAGNKDSAYDIISGIIANKLAIRQLENEQLRQQGQPGNYIVYITDHDLVESKAFPEKVLSLPQKNTQQTDVEKLWNFQKDPLLGLPAELQKFSKDQGYDYYLVICAIYNYFRLDENTDFSNITWTNSDLLLSKGKSSSGNVDGKKTVNNGGYSNLLSHLIKKFKDDPSQPKTNDKAHIYHFVITTYTPFETATDAKPFGRLRHFQGLSWTPPNNDPAFDEVWKTFYSSKQAELAGNNNAKQKKASREEWLSGFVKANQTMLAAIRKTNPQELAAITDKATLVSKLEAIPEPVYAGFSAALRIQMLQILSGDAMANNAEKIVCALIEQAPARQADSVITAMRLTNPFIPATVMSGIDPLSHSASIKPNNMVGWCLLKCLTGSIQDNTMGMGGGNNYHRLIIGLSALSYKSDGFRQQAKALNDAYLNADDDKIPDRVIFYTYNSFWSKVASTFKYTYHFFEPPKIDFSTSYNDDCGLTTEKQLFISYGIDNVTAKKIPLDPFEPIVFENKTDLGLLEDINETPSTGAVSQTKDHIVPAIILKYADDKASTETATDATMAAIDVLSLATGYGELQAGIKGIRKAWVIYDMVNSGINIVGNVAAYDNPTLKSILTYYNLASGVLTLGRLGTGAAKSIKNIYKAIKAENAVMNAANIRAFLSSIKNAGEDLKGLHPDDAERITKYLQRLKAEAKGRNLTNFENKVDDAIAAVNAGGKVVTEAIAVNKIFKRLASLPGVIVDKTSIMVGKTKALIAHWAEGGSTLFIDAAENANSDGKLVDIIQGESYVPKGSKTAVQEDLMIIQEADNSVSCVRGACFVAGTPVHTHNGIKPIEQVRQLEEVLSMDVQSGAKVWEKVVKTFQRTASRLVRVVAGRDTILSTPEHPYYTEAGWKMASEIQPGIKMRLASGLFAMALSTATIDTTVTVYNFEVNRTHNYCIGSQGIVVHNDCLPWQKMASKLKNRYRNAYSVFEEWPNWLRQKFTDQFSKLDNDLKAFDEDRGLMDIWDIWMTGKKIKISSWEDAVREVDAIVAPAMKKIKEMYPDINIKVGYRGSLVKGIKHDGKVFNIKDWDVDAFIVSDDLARTFNKFDDWRNAKDIPELTKMIEDLEEQLIRLEGIRFEPQKPFSFRVWNSTEYVNEVIPNGYKLF